MTCPNCLIPMTQTSTDEYVDFPDIVYVDGKCVYMPHPNSITGFQCQQCNHTDTVFEESKDTKELRNDTSES